MNLILDPDRFAQLGRLGILSPTGKCRAFDATADGTVLGEGVGVVVLKPLSEALRRGDRIYGVIKGSGLSTGNGTVGFTAPNFKILEHFNDFADAEIKKVIKGAPQVDPGDGCFHLSDAPGLGVELDVDAAAEFPQQQARFDLWAEGWETRKPKGAK